MNCRAACMLDVISASVSKFTWKMYCPCEVTQTRAPFQRKTPKFSISPMWRSGPARVQQNNNSFHQYGCNYLGREWVFCMDFVCIYKRSNISIVLHILKSFSRLWFAMFWPAYIDPLQCLCGKLFDGAQISTNAQDNNKYRYGVQTMGDWVRLSISLSLNLSLSRSQKAYN